jgi:hypothetical protein
MCLFEGAKLKERNVIGLPEPKRANKIEDVVLLALVAKATKGVR